LVKWKINGTSFHNSATPFKNIKNIRKVLTFPQIEIMNSPDFDSSSEFFDHKDGGQIFLGNFG
jgi:hypothetical protein